MSGKQILVVNDERPFRAMITFGLGCAGFAVSEAGDAETAREQLAEHLPDLLLVSSTLPDKGALELIREIKEDTTTTGLPIVILTALSGEADRVEALNSGADDYITAPLSAAEFIARIHALLRPRTPEAIEPTSDESLRIDGVTLDPVSHRLLVGEQRMHAPLLQYRILELLMKNPDRVYTRPELAHLLWGTGAAVEERTVDVHVSRLRKILAAGGMTHLLQTVRGIGYRFGGAVSETVV